MSAERLPHGRMASQKAQILKLLRGYRWVKQHELCAITHRFSARIAELRAEGHNITSMRVGETAWEYRLAEGPQLNLL